jgi:Flp pilus assembly protein TadB
MPCLCLPARQPTARDFIVCTILLGFIPHLAGCASTQAAPRKNISEVPVTATEAASERAPLTTQERGDSTSKARRWTWNTSKARKALRRGTYATEEGTKEVARFAGIAALCTVAAAALGGLLYLNLTNDG